MGIYNQCGQYNQYYPDFTREDVINMIRNLPWDYSPKEYNTNTSAGHPVKGDDIVRTLWKHKELQNKESVR